MNKESNLYIFGYSSILVVVVAVVLTVANLYLKPYQERNIRIEKMSDILAAVGIDSDAKTAEELFGKYIKEELVINSKPSICGISITQIIKSGKLPDCKSFKASNPLSHVVTSYSDLKVFSRINLILFSSSMAIIFFIRAVLKV